MITRVVGPFAVMVGILTIVVPIMVFPDCTRVSIAETGRPIIMICHWSVQATIGIGALIVLCGLLLTISRSRGGRLCLSTVLAGLGIVGVLMPTTLIGVCANMKMACRTGTLPALLLLNGFTITAGVVGFVAAARCRREGAVCPAP